MSFFKTEFKDGITYHDYHFNTLQYNIAAGIKKQKIESFYDSFLEYSDYIYSYINPVLIENIADIRGPLVFPKGELNNIVFDEKIMSLKIIDGSSSGDFTSETLSLPEEGSSIILFAEENIPKDSTLTYQISFDNQETWIDIEKNIELTINEIEQKFNNITLKINFNKTGSDSPEVVSFCLMWK